MAEEKVQLIKRQVEALNKEIDEIERFDRKEVEEIAEKYSSKKSSWLVALTGGLIGGGAGVSIPLISVLGVSSGLAVITGPAGMALGAALAILAWRGRKYQRLERETEKAKIALDELEKRIGDLPQNAPRYIKEGLWKQYSAISDRYSEIVLESLYDKSYFLPAGPSRPEQDVIEGEVIDVKPNPR
jgi:prefoldin subunit 5